MLERPLLGKYWWHFIKAKVRIVWKVLCCYHGDNEGLSVINHSSYERSQSMKMTINRKLHENDCDFYFSRQTIRLFLYKYRVSQKKLGSQNFQIAITHSFLKLKSIVIPLNQMSRSGEKICIG